MNVSVLVDPSAPTVATLGNRPAPETALPAPADVARWTAKLTAVPTNAALWAAEHLGAVVAECGGENEYAYGHHETRGWYSLDAYDNHTRVGRDDLPDNLEIDTWPSADSRADGRTVAELAGKVDHQAESLYLGLAEAAASSGEAEAFRAAVEALYTADPFAMDADLYAELAGVDLAEPDWDEDIGSNR